MSASIDGKTATSIDIYQNKLLLISITPNILLIVGVENGYDEVNVQIPAKYKYVFSQQIMLDQENVATYVPEIKLRLNSI